MAYFNLCSREGSDEREVRAGKDIIISIHAPARGATGLLQVTKRNAIKFQSTLPRGERPTIRSHFLSFRCHFNPRSREGSDQMQAQKRAILQRISIHAPARGATVAGYAKMLTEEDFNPRSREGSDVNPLPRRGASIRFQSTLPRGERLQFYLKFTLCF